MAVPKKRMSHMRSGTRRSQLKVTLPTLTDCPQCHEPRLPHTVCGNCGTYRARAILDKPINVAAPAPTE